MPDKKMEEEKKIIRKYLDLKKLLLLIFFVGVTLLFEYIYDLTNTTATQSSQDVFPSWISSFDASMLVQINPALTNPYFNTIFFICFCFFQTFFQFNFGFPSKNLTGK